MRMPSRGEAATGRVLSRHGHPERDLDSASPSDLPDAPVSIATCLAKPAAQHHLRLASLRLFLVRRPLGHMIRHVDEDAADVIIGCRVNDLTALALGANETGRAQQAQVVADPAYAHV